MTTETQIAKSLERMFLSDSNIKDVSSYLGRPLKKEMILWASKRKLDDYESVQMDYSEALNFANIEFAKKYKLDDVEINMASGNKFPKYYIQDGVANYDVEDFRKHDAQQVQSVMVSNANFRYGNKFKKWETSLYKRYYDTKEHENGLRDTRELLTLDKKYNMENIYGENPYKSSGIF